jgi:hypothetical protein
MEGDIEDVKTVESRHPHASAAQASAINLLVGSNHALLVAMTPNDSSATPGQQT